MIAPLLIIYSDLRQAPGVVGRVLCSYAELFEPALLQPSLQLQIIAGGLALVAAPLAFSVANRLEHGASQVRPSAILLLGLLAQAWALILLPSVIAPLPGSVVPVIWAVRLPNLWGWMRLFLVVRNLPAAGSDTAGRRPRADTFPEIESL